MPISRDARMDRRRRILRDTVEEEAQPVPAVRRGSRKAAEADGGDTLGIKRKAGYSQDVRKACGQRLVQLIPVRRRSFALACLVSLLIPGLLLALHYWIHVTGQLPWWRHPLAVALDVGHPRSIAAWLSSQLWLLCLGATVLTFQLRRHKLDDYNGEYRLWFWLVVTCLVASIDATTSITQLFAQALDRWTQVNIGWSGPAVVDATLAVLIGMLGLRMCTELKVVPLSLVLWLVGLVAWAGSAALARPELRLEMSAPIRYWLISALWMSGLTLVWLAALSYLRHIYMEAQQRFLLRGGLATTSMPLKQRWREAMPAMPTMPAMPRLRRLRAEGTGPAAEPDAAPRWRLPRLPKLARRAAPELVDAAGAQAVGAQAAVAAGVAAPAAAKGASAASAASAAKGASVASAASATTSRSTKPDQPAREQGDATEDAAKPRRGLGGWLRRAKDDDEADEYRKVSAASETAEKTAGGPTADRRTQRAEAKAMRSEAKAERRAQAAQAKQERVAQRAQAKQEHRSAKGAVSSQAASKKAAGKGAAGDQTQDAAPRRWMPKLPRPKLPTLGKAKLPKVPAVNLAGWIPRLKLPSIGLSALRLQPPEEGKERQPAAAARAAKMRPVNEARPLPSTKASPADHFDDDDDDDHDGRPLSKAEKKRLRRDQQGRRAA